MRPGKTLSGVEQILLETLAPRTYSCPSAICIRAGLFVSRFLENERRFLYDSHTWKNMAYAVHRLLTIQVGSKVIAFLKVCDGEKI